MTKSNGLGDKLLIAGYDLSGDIASINGMGGGPAPLIVTGINSSAVERIGGVRDGAMDVASWFNDAAAQQHAILKLLPATDVHLMYLRGTTLGNAGIGLVGKQADYKASRPGDGSMSFAAQFLANGFGIEMGQQLTAGLRTDTAATNGTGVDNGAAAAGAVAVNITSVGVANPGQVNATAHGLVTGDSVVIAGTTTTPSINGSYAVTRVNDNQFTIPVNVTSGQAGAAGTVIKTSTSYGLSGYSQVTAFTGTSVTLKYQDSADDGVVDAYADITGAAFAAATGITAERIATASTKTIKRYVRLVSTGTFNPATFANLMVRHLAPSL